MPAYDASFEPPAPLAQIILRNPQSMKTVAGVPMLLDSGADVTLVPATFADELGLIADDDLEKTRDEIEKQVVKEISPLQTGVRIGI